MGNRHRKDKLRCSKCYKRDNMKYSLGHIHSITWQNVIALPRDEKSANCECRTCGHKYISKSKAALRLLKNGL